MTPSNTREVSKQVTFIKKRMERESVSPTPLKEAIDQLAKGATLMATSLALIQAQLKDQTEVWTAKEARKKKTNKSIHTDKPMSVSQG